MTAPLDVVIAGGGFAGTVLAAELVRRRPGVRLTLIDPATPGFGNAYATTVPAHLMNGPVRAMSAVPDAAGDLGRWLGSGAQPDDLISRPQFGAYVAQRFADSMREAPHAAVRRGVVVDVEPNGGHYTVQLDDGSELTARAVVFATGNAPPSASFAAAGVAGHPRFIADAWRFTGAGPAGAVLCIGGGLTALDTLAALDAHGFAGRVTMVSRHGVMPLLEDASVRAADPAALDLDRSSPEALLHTMRRAARRGAERGLDWRAVAESIRREIPVIWSGWDAVQRRRFLRHLQAYWSIHRYRVPAATSAVRDAFAARGALVSVRGRVRSLVLDGDGFLAHVRTASGERTIAADWAIDCSGPEGDVLRVERPLERALLRRGLIRPDALRLGWDVTAGLAPIGAHGEPWPNLFVIGPATRGRFYECTGVPEIRAQAAQVAAALSGGA